MDKKMAVAITLSMVVAVIAGLAIAKVWLNPQDDPGKDDFEGEWDLVMKYDAFYADGEPYIGAVEVTMDLGIEKIDEKYYRVILGDSRVVAVSNGDMLMTTGLDDCDSAYVYPYGDVLVMYILYESMASFLVFQEEGSEPTEFSREGWGSSPAGAERTFDAFRAVEVRDGTAIDHMDRGYTLTVLMYEEPFVFYNVSNSEFSWDYVGLEIMDDYFVAATDLGNQYIVDMVHVDGDVIYTSSYDGLGGNEVALWCVAYGDPSKERPVDDISYTCKGIDTVYGYGKDGYELRGHQAASLSVTYQEGNMLILESETDDGTRLILGGVIAEEDGGYFALAESYIFTETGMIMCGFGLCYLPLDGSGPVKIFGIESDLESTYVVFDQEYRILR